MNICEHMRYDVDHYTSESEFIWTFPDAHQEILCEFCAAELGFCTSCGTFIGRDMSVPENEQSEPEWLIGENITVVSWGDVQMCDKCAGLE